MILGLHGQFTGSETYQNTPPQDLTTYMSGGGGPDPVDYGTANVYNYINGTAAPYHSINLSAKAGVNFTAIWVSNYPGGTPPPAPPKLTVKFTPSAGVVGQLAFQYAAGFVMETRRL